MAGMDLTVAAIDIASLASTQPCGHAGFPFAVSLNSLSLLRLDYEIDSE